MSDAPIVFDRLTRYFGSRCVLDTLSIEVPRGSVFALLGRNGAGKTTAIRCLLGLLEPTRGSARVLGHDARHLPPDIRARIAYVAEDHRMVPSMRLGAIVDLQAASFPAFDAHACRGRLNQLGLSEKAKPKNLSRGQRAQASLALALATTPEVVVLDDPALGLDAVVRREFLETVIELIQHEGRTVFLTSHLLGDVERVADHVAILVNGVLRVAAPLDEVRRRVVRLHGFFPGEAPEFPGGMPGVVRSVRRRNELLVTVANEATAAGERLRAMGATLVEEETLGLEDLFIDYTGGTAQGAGE
ncbi:MAG: ABC transporter ATP-binding protein [Planctomycetes bacterium]|nr:ABC transporter ATP-binding protein [Planctomycetota bacterium]